MGLIWTRCSECCEETEIITSASSGFGFYPGLAGCFGIASMKTTMQEWDGRLHRRYRCCIWKQRKRPRTRAKSLMRLGIPEWQGWAVSNCRKAYWHMAKNGHKQRALSKERLAQAGYDSILDRYESLYLCD
ncbi:MAG: group II intron maturase-specific domain-containing protein [Faecousia sp.]